MKPLEQVARTLVPLGLLLVATALAVVFLGARGTWWASHDHDGWVPLTVVGLCVLPICLRLGRVEPVLITLLPLALGAAVVLPVYDHAMQLRSPPILGIGIGCMLGAFHALQLSSWQLRCWRRQESPRAGWPLHSMLVVGGSYFLIITLFQRVHQGEQVRIAQAGLVAFAGLALPAHLLVPRAWRLALRHHGVNGTPALRGVYGGWWILWTLASRGLLFLLTDRSADRRRAAVDAIHRIAAYLPDNAPLNHYEYLNTGRERFATPRVLVANHTSMFDILAILAVPVPTILLIRDWVWKTPVMGHMTQAAGYINVDALTHEEIVERAREAVAAGFSLLVFPEGTRSRDGRVGRFKNGAFAIARAIGVPVTPIALVGTLTVVRAGTWWLGDGDARISALDDMQTAAFEGDLADKRMAREARDRIRAEIRRLTPRTHSGPRWHRRVGGLYRYLGATVSHYAASKARRDPLVEAIPRLCPGEGPVLHAGCGYALLTAHLALCQPWRDIHGIDSDARKVEVAQAALGETTGARFEVGDLRDVDLGTPETILLVDVLHYWPAAVQGTLVQRLAAALAPGGRIVFRDGVRAAGGHGLVHLGERLALLLGFTRAGAGLHFRTEWEYRTLFEQAGFAVSSAHPDLGLSSNLVLVLQRGA